MKILEIKNDKVKFNSKKENEVLVDVFLRKSFNELNELKIVDSFDEMKNDENWRKYIECKLKVLMGVDNGNCFKDYIKLKEDNKDGTLEEFYRENILDKFLEKKGLFENVKGTNIDFKKYFSQEIKNNKSENIFVLNNSKKWNFIGFVDKIKKAESENVFLDSGKFYNKNGLFAFIDYDNNLILAFKYRLPINFNIDVILKRIRLYIADDFILLGFKNEKNIKIELESFLFSKIDLTQDIQEVKVEQKIELSDEKTREIFEISDNNEDVDISS